MHPLHPAKIFGWHPKTSRSVFAEKARECLDDRRIAGYFGRGLVDKDDVMDALMGEPFTQATENDSYEQYDDARNELQGTIEENSDIINGGAVDRRSASVYVCAIVLLLTVVVSAFYVGIETVGIMLAALIPAGLSAWLFGKVRIEHYHRYRRVAVSIFGIVISLCAIILPHFYLKLPWAPFSLFLSLGAALTTGYLLRSAETVNKCGNLLLYAVNWISILSRRPDFSRFQRWWLDSCVENVIIPNAVLTINTTLGEDKDRLLVEQDSEGLRKLQDPTFTISTSTERRIASALAQMDGGSIALAGPRGAGKSTLLRTFSGRGGAEHINAPISVYLAAPAEYIPRDFIAELLQRLCEAYLLRENCRMPEPIYKERKHNLKRALGRVPGIVRLVLKTTVVLGIITWLAWPVIGHLIRAHYHYHYYYISSTNSIRHWFDRTYTHMYHFFHSKFKKIWTLLAIASRIIVIVIVLVRLPSLSTWRKRIGLRKEPPLAKTARDYLLRLQVEKTVTWGKTLNLNPVNGRLMGATLNKGGTASYASWTLPELVGYTRRFMQDISNAFKGSTHAVVVGIDEIDRIGSLDHAERFIGEIKAVFGVERCFFLVAVAEDIGSIFAQRATAGRSILENAFDDIVVVEPLNFEETRDLLLKRVPGFTDSFVYLSYALSGGLPRELIRVTRRLVEVNQKLGSMNRHPRLEDLAFILVKNNIVESIRATRAQISRLALNTDWATVFEILHSASFSLRSASVSSIGESLQVIEKLSELKTPLDATGQAAASIVGQDEGNARRIIQDFSAYAYFGLIVIDAFSDGFFDLQTVQQQTSSGSEHTYEELALARNELSVSSASSRAMLSRFRNSLRPRNGA